MLLAGACVCAILFRFSFFHTLPFHKVVQMRDVCVSFEGNGQGRCRGASPTHFEPTECSSAPQSAHSFHFIQAFPNSHLLLTPLPFSPFRNRFAGLQGPFFLLSQASQLSKPRRGCSTLHLFLQNSQYDF